MGGIPDLGVGETFKDKLLPRYINLVTFLCYKMMV